MLQQLFSLWTDHINTRTKYENSEQFKEFYQKIQLHH